MMINYHLCNRYHSVKKCVVDIREFNEDIFDDLNLNWCFQVDDNNLDDNDKDIEYYFKDFLENFLQAQINSTFTSEDDYIYDNMDIVDIDINDFFPDVDDFEIDKIFNIPRDILNIIKGYNNDLFKHRNEIIRDNLDNDTIDEQEYIHEEASSNRMWHCTKMGNKMFNKLIVPRIYILLKSMKEEYGEIDIDDCEVTFRVCMYEQLLTMLYNNNNGDMNEYIHRIFNLDNLK